MEKHFLPIDSDSDTVWYDKQEDRCNAHQCSYVEFSINDIAYRDSCDPGW